MNASTYTLRRILRTTLGLILVGLMPRAAATQVPLATCTISTTAAISFGTYSVFNPSPTDSIGSVVYACTGNVGPVTISLSGTQPTGSRMLKNGADLLSYDIFVDAARTQSWGDGTFGSAAATFPPPPDASIVTAVMYGRIFPEQDVAIGAYTDTLVAVIDF